MDEQSRNFTAAYGRLFSLFLGFSGLAAVLFFGSVLFTQYAPVGAGETVKSATIEAVTYGTSEAHYSKERPIEPQGNSCYLQMENGELFDAPLLGCDFTEGDSLLVVKGDLGDRLSPENFPETIFALRICLGLGFALGVFGFGSLLIARRSSKSSSEVAHGVRF